MFDKPQSDLIPVLDEAPPQVQEVIPVAELEAPVEIDEKPVDSVVAEITDVIPDEPQPKSILKQEDIFVNKNRPKTPVKSRSPERVITGSVASPLKEKPKLTKSGRKPRKPMSDEHKAKLAEARKKALAVRKANKAKRDEERAQKKTLAQERKEEREKIQAQREEKKLQAEILKARQENEIREAEQRNLQRQKNLISVPNEISREVIEEMMFQGIARYDQLRKKQKAEKRAKEAEIARERKIVQTINSAHGRTTPIDNRYGHCFSFH